MKIPKEQRDAFLYNVLSTDIPPDAVSVIAEHWRDDEQVGTVTCALTQEGDRIILLFRDSVYMQIGDQIRLPEDGVGLTLESVHPSVSFRFTRYKVAKDDDAT